MVGVALTLHFNSGIWSQDSAQIDPPKLEPKDPKVKPPEVKKAEEPKQPVKAPEPAKQPEAKAKAPEPAKEAAKEPVKAVEPAKQPEAKADAKDAKAEPKADPKDAKADAKAEPAAAPPAPPKGDPTGENNVDTSIITPAVLKASGKEKIKKKNDKGVEEEVEVDYAPNAKDFSEGFASLANSVGGMKAAINMFWTLVTGFLVMFMQAGFAMVEAGLCRTKSVAHTMAMNFMVYGLGMLGFYFIGFGLMWGGSGAANWGGSGELLTEMAKYDDKWGLYGKAGFMLTGKAFDASIMCLFLFQMVFMDTTCTIPTGAMAERWNFLSFVIYSLIISTLIYPVYGCWVWGGGWLSQLGALKQLGHGHVDFAGSSVVHMTGGVCALAGCLLIGARIGKFGKNGEVHVLPAHSVPMYMVGTFILAFGWFGFNPGSSLAATDMNIARCAVNTMLASAAGAFTSMVYMWLVFGKPDPSFMCNGMLAGLVAITGPCAFLSPGFAVFVGAVAGILVIWSCLFWERIIKIDDPVGAVSVHGVNGAFGILCIGLFADGTYGKGLNNSFWAKSNASGVYQWFEARDKIPTDWTEVGVTGIWYGNTGQLSASLIGIGANIVFVFVASLVMFKVLDLVFGLRSKPEDEMAGLDIPEMGVLGYINDDPKTPEGHLYSAGIEPKTAKAPPDGKKRFTVMVEGLAPDKIAAIWGDLCQPTKKPSPEFLAVYPKMTLLQGNKFKFIDGNPEQISAQLAKVLQASSNGGSVKASVEK